MASDAEHDLLFGVTALQLQFVTQEQLVAATAEAAAGSGRSLRDRLCDLKLLSQTEADAVAAVVRERLARFGNDPKQTLDSVGAAEAAALASRPATIPFGKADYATRTDHFATQAARAWSYSAQHQRFTILRLHQQGGLGRLMIAQDAELNREIALKEILPAFADSEDNRRRFIREAEITGALEHPGIVPVYSLGEFADGRPYYAMRLVRGVDLRGALQDFHSQAAAAGGARRAELRLEFRQLLSRFVSVCRAVHYAHTRGVIHRDLKPGNIMLGDHGETLVIDWGLAKTLDGRPSPDDFEVAAVTPSERASSDRTQAGRIVGTTQYMSPEQAEGRVDRLSPASDIYGLGATLYHVLCGRPPLEGNEDDIVLRVQQGRFAPPRTHDPRVPRPLEAICLKAMARKPADRYTTARDLAEDVERYLADERVLAYPEPPTARAWRWIRHHRTAVLSLMAAAIVAVSALTAGVVLLSAANVRERDARRQATDNFEKAEAERERAERNFQLAQEAVREYFVRVSEETLLNQVGMQPLRDALLRQALAYYEKFLAERQDDPQLRRDVAQAQYFVGRITETIDSPAKALAHYEQAAALQKRLLGAANASGGVSSSDAALNTEYAQTLNALGRAHQLLQQSDKARSYFEQAAALREELAAKSPQDAEIARALASSKMNLGMLLARGGDVAKGLPLLEQAQALRLAHADPANPTPAMQRDLGMGYYNLATAHLAAGDAEAAEKDLRAAIEQFEQLAESTPQDLENIRRLATTRRLVADVRAAAGDEETAIKFFEQARESLRELATKNPDVPDYAADLAGVQMNLGAQLEATGDLAGGLTEMLAAVETLRGLRERETATPRHLRDLGAALRAASGLQLQQERREEARALLEESREVLSGLVREHPTDDDFADQLKQTADAMAELDAI